MRIRPTASPWEAGAWPRASRTWTTAKAQSMEWAMVGIGAAVALLVIFIDLHLRRREAGFRVPVLAVAVGIYLPVQLAVAILVGGVMENSP